MLSRRHLRIKVLQAVYAFFQNGNTELSKGEKQLLTSVDKIHELFIHQLSFLIEMRDFASNRIEGSKKKFFPTEEDLNPSMKFVNNRALKQIEENREFRRLHDRMKINWSDEDSVVRKGYLAVKESNFFQKYLEGSDDTFETDAELLARIVKKVFSGLELLEYHYESQSIYWAFDSYHTANLMVMKYLKALKPTDGPESPLPEMIDNGSGLEDKQFMINLFRKTILHSNEYAVMIDEKARNWELERIAMMDTILIKMALAELLEFPSIPVKVTLNEYIDISKYYSSAKSKVFINGVLDKLIVDLKEKKMIKKTGRGLME